MIESVPVFILGIIVGSFLNVCIGRIPNEESVVFPPSHCPKCKAAITFYDNFPLLSYLWLRGKCRACHEAISPRYFLVELLTGLVALALYSRFGLSYTFVVSFVFAAALIVISFIDLDVRIVPDVISLPGIIIGLVFSVIGYFCLYRRIRNCSDPAKLAHRDPCRWRVFAGDGLDIRESYRCGWHGRWRHQVVGDDRCLSRLAFDSRYAFHCVGVGFGDRCRLDGGHRCRAQAGFAFRPVSMRWCADLSFLRWHFDSILFA